MAWKGSPSPASLLLLLLATLLLPSTAPTESDVLLKFKSTLSGGAAVALQDWTPGSDPCNGDHPNWPGIICLNGSVYGLQLENMSLSGVLTIDGLEELPTLRTLSFMNNQLGGPMPDVGRLPALKSVYLSGNRLSGPIPADTFKGMRKLKKVYLSGNQFTGPVPASLTSLLRLLVLRLDDNGFQGRLPDFRQPGLSMVNVSYNNLQGPIPEGLQRMNAALFMGNEDLCGPPLDVECEPTTGLPKKKKLSTALLILIILLVIIVMLAILAFIVVQLRRRRRHEEMQSGRPTSAKQGSLEPSDAEKVEQGSSEFSGGSKRTSKEVDHGRLVFVKDTRERFELQDLLRASAEILGSGNFGSSYKAILLQGPSVVVKRFKDMNGVGREDFQEHMRRLGRLSHPNLLPLVAYYYRKEEKLLVTDYIYNGSLAHMLHGNRGSSLPPLDWPTRLKIIKGVARGLAYLYDELPMLSLPHGHLKSSNVLITESYEALLTDYALIPVMNQSHASQVMIAYKSPEVTHSGKISKKSDVWSFGILILEVLTGKFPTTYLQRGKGSEDLVSWVDSVVKEEWTGDVFDGEMKGTSPDEHHGEGEMVKLMRIGLACCEEDVDKRWEMSQVLDKIEELGKGGGDEGSSSFVSDQGLKAESPFSTVVI